MFQYYPHQAIVMEQETDLIQDVPDGPLSIYRNQASFDWKKLKLVFDKPDILKLKVNTVCIYFLISIWYRTLLVWVTVIHHVEKFTTVTEIKATFSITESLWCASCKSLHFQFSWHILVRCISIAIHLPLGL
jgi:hypothetical protein